MLGADKDKIIEIGGKKSNPVSMYTIKSSEDVSSLQQKNILEALKSLENSISVWNGCLSSRKSWKKYYGRNWSSMDFKIVLQTSTCNYWGVATDGGTGTVSPYSHVNTEHAYPNSAVLQTSPQPEASLPVLELYYLIYSSSVSSPGSSWFL